MSHSDWDAKVYHRISEPQLRWGRTVLARLPLHGDETVLDAGCGSGRLTAELVVRLPRGHVLALDRSGPMLAEARENLAPYIPRRATIVQGDLGDLRLDRSVDAVFSAATFHWVLDHEALFRGLAGVMRPGAVLAAQCGGEGNLRRTLARAMMWVANNARDLAPGDYPAYFAGVPITEERLSRHGFTDIHVDLEDAPTPFEDGPSYRLFIEKVVLARLLDRLPHEPDRAALLDHMTELAGADPAPFHLDYVRLNMQATRRR